MSIQPTPWYQKPVQCIQQGAGFVYSCGKTALEILHESQKMTTHFILGGGLKFANKRIALGTSNPMKNPFQPLQKMDGELAIFDQHQPSEAKNVLPPIKIENPTTPSTGTSPTSIAPPSSTSTVTPAKEPSNPSAVIDQIAETDRQLKIFSNNLTYFLPLYTMACLGGIKDPDMNQVILSMVIEASAPRPDGTKPSVKDIFYQKYGLRLHFWQKIQIWFFNIFGSSSFFSTTVEAYMQHFLKETRERLSNSRWTEKGENIERLIDDIIHFLDLYKNATFNYAEAREPTGGLNQYRSQACDKMFQKSLKEISEEFSHTVIGNLSPKVQYFTSNNFLSNIANDLLNWIVKKIIHHFLPSGIHSILLQTDDATKSHYLPFVKALTDSVTEQLQKLLQNLDTETSREEHTPIAGTQKLKDAIESLFYIIQFSKSNTQEAILQKRKELEEKRKEKNFNKEIQQGIQDSILKGIQVFLRHMAEPTNSEQMFTQFCVLANASFSKGELITEQDFQDSKDKLNLTVHTVGKRLANEAVEDKIRGSRPEQIEKMANLTFSTHKTDAEALAKGLELSIQSITQKINRTDLEYQQEQDILPELDQIVQTLRPFSTKEQISKDLKNLPEAEQESILRPLIPIYQCLEKISPLLLVLQEQQILYKVHFQIQKQLLEIQEILQFLIQRGPSEQALQKLPLLESAIDKIAKQLPPTAPETTKMKQEFRTIHSTFQKAFQEKRKNEYLVLLKKHIEELRKAIISNRSDHKKIALQKISKVLELIPQEDANNLIPILKQFSYLTPASDPNGFNTISQQLDQNIQSLETTYKNNQDSAFQHLGDLSTFQLWIQDKVQGYASHQKKNQETILQSATDLSNEISQLNQLVTTTQKEKLFNVTPRHLGIIGGAALGVTALISPAAALALGAGSYMALRYIEPIIKGGEERKLALLKSLATGAAVFAGSYIPAISNVVATAEATKPWAKVAAIGGSALLGANIATSALDECVSAGQSLVFQQITEFFESTYEFLLSGEIYQPSAKIAMQEVVNAFKRT